MNADVGIRKIIICCLKVAYWSHFYFGKMRKNVMVNNVDIVDTNNGELFHK